MNLPQRLRRAWLTLVKRSIQPLKQSQDGIALLTLSDTHHHVLQGAEVDLQALTRA